MGIIFISLIAQISMAQAFWNPSGIYGEDNRLEPYEIQDPILREQGFSSVALVGKKKYQENSDGSLELNRESYGQANNLCASEKFVEQLSPAFCSGVLVGRNLVLTAGHCLEKSRDCQNTRFIFDFENSQRGRPALVHVAANLVFRCKNIFVPSKKLDYALVELDRDVPDRRPQKFERSEEIELGLEVGAVGYPQGLPMKFVDSAKVRKVSKNHFETNLDTYSGNSGSPVFERISGRLLGILIEGDDDFVKTKEGCFISKHCSDQSCSGEKVLKVNAILDHSLNLR